MLKDFENKAPTREQILAAEKELELLKQQKKYYFPMKLVGYGKDEEEAWGDAVDGFSSDPGIMDEFEEADEDMED